MWWYLIIFLIEKTMTRAENLRNETHGMHEILDHYIMAFNPFSNAEKYAAFLKMQYAFHRDVGALFSDAKLNELLPDLSHRIRLHQVEQDLNDVKQDIPQITHKPYFDDKNIDVPTALGWLYVEEGSNLGAAFLYKAAAKLNFDQTNGARHLAPHEAGRAPSWKLFLEQFNAIPLSAEDEQKMIEGAKKAFEQVTGYAKTFLKD